MRGENATPEALAALVQAGRVYEVWAVLYDKGGALAALIEIERPGWLLGLVAEQLDPWESLLDDKALFPYAMESARLLLPFVEAAFPYEARPRQYLDAARAAVLGSGSHEGLEERRQHVLAFLSELKCARSDARTAEGLSYQERALAAARFQIVERAVTALSAHPHEARSYFASKLEAHLREAARDFAFDEAMQAQAQPFFNDALERLSKERQAEIKAGGAPGPLQCFPALQPVADAERLARVEAAKAEDEAARAFRRQAASRLLLVLRHGGAISIAANAAPARLVERARAGQLHSVWAMLSEDDCARLRQSEEEAPGWWLSVAGLEFSLWSSLLEPASRRGAVLLCLWRAVRVLEHHRISIASLRAYVVAALAATGGPAAPLALTQAEDEVLRFFFADPKRARTGRMSLPTEYAELPLLLPAHDAARSSAYKAAVLCITGGERGLSGAANYAARAVSYVRNDRALTAYQEAPTDEEAEVPPSARAFLAWNKAHRRTLAEEAFLRGLILASVLEEAYPALASLYPLDLLEPLLTMTGREVRH